MATNDRRSKRTRWALIAGALTWGVGALVWRAGWTLDGASRWLSIPLLAVEIWAVVRLVLLVTVTQHAPADDGDPSTDEPTPDIEMLVPAAHATPTELGRTLVVAKADPPHRIVVLDDRRRPEIEAEAIRHGAAYEVVDVARDAGDISAALIGTALRDTDAELIAWVDAGDVLAPGLAELAAPFRRRDVAVVQGATDYSNRDSLLHSSPRHDERAVDEQIIGPALGSIGAAPWNGSGSLVRVAAVRALGGLVGTPGGTTVAALDLAAAGWRTEFSRQPVVRVAAPDTLDEYLAAVAARAAGPWRTLFGPQSILTRRDLGLRRRLAAVEVATRPIDGAARLILLAVLALTIWTGHLPVTASIAGLAFIWAPAQLLRFRALMAVAGGTLDTGDLTRQSLRRMGVHLQVLVGRGPARWATRPEPDGRRSGARAVRVVGHLPVVTIAAVVLNAGIIARGVTFWAPHLMRPLSDTARIVVMAMAVVALVPIVDVLQVLVNRQQRRANHRVNAVLLAEVAGTVSKAHDLTPTGLGVDVVDPPAVGQRVPVVLAVPRVTGELHDVRATGIVKHVSDPYRGARLSRRGGAPLHRVGLQLVDVGPEARDALVELCALTASERDRVRDRRAEHTPDALDVPSPRGWRTGLAMLNVVGLLTAGLVVVGAPAGAEAPAAEQAKRTTARASKEGTGSSIIHGRVIGERGEGVADMCVGVRDIDAPTATTDGDGWFALEQLPVGDHIVAASDCKGVGGGFAETFHPSAPVASQSKVVTSTDGEKTEITIQMLTIGMVSGEVVDEQQEPASDVCVAFSPNGGDETLDLGRTDDDGRYAVAAPGGSGSFLFTDCSGKDRFTATWWPGVADRQSAKIVDVVAHDEVSLDRLAMQRPARLTGHVTTRDGNPLPDVCVSVQDVTNGQWNGRAWTATDGDGNYDLAVPSGTHSLYFQDCGKERDLVATWFGGAPTATTPAPTIDIATGARQQFDQVLERGSRMSGVLLTPEGEPAAGACVALHPAEQLLDQGDWTTASWNRPDPKSGAWTSEPLPDGSYLLQFVNCDEHGYTAGGTWSAEFYDGVFTELGGSPHDSKVFEVSIAHEPLFVEHRLRRTSRLQGTVTNRGTGVGQVCVGTSPAVGTTRTGDDGTWSMSVPTGEYGLIFTDCRPGRGLQQIVDKVGVGDGEVQSLDIEMRRGEVGTMTGRIVADDGRALANACVVAYVPNDAAAFGVVAPEGTWELPGLGAGDYWLAATDCERPGSPIGAADGKATYPTTWYPAAPADLSTGTNPDRDGGKVARLEAGSSQDDLEICLGDCSATPTTEQPASAPPVTAPNTTAPPTTRPPMTAPAVPTTTPSVADDDRAVGDPASRAAAMTAGEPDAALERRPATTVATGLAATASAGATDITSARSATNGTKGPSTTTGVSGEAQDRARVEGISADAPERSTDGGAPDVIAFRGADGPAVGRTVGTSHGPWSMLAGIGITAMAAIGLLLARRRSSDA